MAIDEPLILYSRVDCHLCDQVVLMLDRAGVSWRPVDIDADPELVKRYGIRVPVLQIPDSGRELFFPFSDDELLEFARSGESP
jgi:glutaredoxin